MKTLLSALVTIIAVQAQSFPCGNDLWPVYAGQENLSVTTSCITYDKVNELLIIGGTTEDKTNSLNPE